MENKELYVIDENGVIVQIDGFTIPKLKLSEEDAKMPLTIYRIRDFHYEVGEDFLDQFCNIADYKVFAGFIAHKHPKIAHEIYSTMNKAGKYGEINTFSDLSIYEDDVDDVSAIYIDFVDFVNTTVNALKRVNEVLLSVAHHYKD